MVKVKYMFFLMIIQLLLSCSNVEDNLNFLYHHRISIPSEKLDKIMTKNSESCDYELLFYVCSSQCQSCYLSQLVKYIKQNDVLFRKLNVDVICVFQEDMSNSHYLKDEIINA